MPPSHLPSLHHASTPTPPQDFANASLAADFKVASGALGALPPMQQWAAEYEAYVREVAAAYPRAIIVSLVYPLEQQLVGVRTPEQTLAYLQYMAAAGTRFQAAGLRNVYTLMVGAGWWVLGGGCWVVGAGWWALAVRPAPCCTLVCVQVQRLRRCDGSACCGLPAPGPGPASNAHTRAPTCSSLRHGPRSPWLQLDGSTFPNTNWCRFHPDAASHALIAQQVAAFVRRVVPGWARP